MYVCKENLKIYYFHLLGEGLEGEPQKEGCSWNLNSNLAASVLNPLFFYHGSSNFVTPKPGSLTVEMAKDESIDVYCNGPFKMSGLGDGKLTISCVSGSNFNVKGRTVPIKDLECKWRYPTKTTILNQTCAHGDRGTIIHNGFEVPSKLIGSNVTLIIFI